jgi:hypothetical protein
MWKLATGAISGRGTDGAQPDQATKRCDSDGTTDTYGNYDAVGRPGSLQVANGQNNTDYQWQYTDPGGLLTGYNPSGSDLYLLHAFLRRKRLPMPQGGGIQPRTGRRVGSPG